MNNEIIYNIIENHAIEKSGLFLLDAITGFGKTHHVIKYIQNHYQDKKIFFVANQLKLLPTVEKLAEGLQPDEKEKMKNEILSLTSYVDSYKNSFESSYQNMDDEFKVMNDMLLRSMNSLVINLKKEKDSEIIKLFYEKFTLTEYDLRKQIKAYIKLKGIKKNELLKKEWLTNLYPAMLLEKKKIIFLSTKKFFLPIDIIYSSSVLLYNKTYPDSLLFIDEFDATKRIVLDTIIELDEHNYKVDCFRLFRLLNEVIEKKTLSEYTKNWNNNDVNKAIDLLEITFHDLYEKYNELLLYPFKTNDITLNDKRFIFNDGITLSISKGSDNNQFYFYFDEKEKFNYIIKANKTSIKTINPSYTYHKLENIFQEILDVIYEFIEKTTIIVQGYLDFTEKNRDRYESEFDSQDACTTVIDFLNIGEENKQFLVNKILESYTIVLKAKKYVLDPIEENDIKEKRKYSFYQNGFSYLEIKDDVGHNLESKCYLYSYNLTPEKLLISAANRYRIIGISATSAIESPLVNYDLEYIKYRLSTNCLFATNEELAELKKVTNEYQQQIYHNSNIEIEFMDGKEEYAYLETIWKNIFADNNNNLLEEHLSLENDKYKYLYSIVGNLYCVFKKFVDSTDMSSFIYFLNFNPATNKKLSLFFSNVLDNIIGDKTDVEYVILDSKIFATDYCDSVKKEKLEKGKRIFVITTYQTIGTGINLQYMVTEDNKKYHAHLSVGEERDYDGIYLSKPTYVFPFLSSSYFDYSALANAIYAFEYLKIKTEIGPQCFKNNIAILFKKSLLNWDGKYALDKYYKYDSICLGATRTLIQAIGRICRTKNKTPNIRLFVDKGNIDYLYPVIDNFGNKDTNYEFGKLLEKISEEVDFTDKNIAKINYIKKNDEANQYIYNLMQGFHCWKPKDMEEWKELRRFVLTYPTCDSNTFHKFASCYFSFEDNVNSYSYQKYKKDNTYCINVSKSIDKYDYRMSSQIVGLDKAILKTAGLKEYFEDNGFTTLFKKNKYIMPIDFYHRIYKGALGEEIGKYLLSTNDIYLEEINNPYYFERFDYVYNNVYFDFKFWREDFHASEEEQIKKIVRKAKEVGTTYIFIINVYSEYCFSKQKYVVDGITIFTFPYLYDIKEAKINKEAIALIKEAINLF
jgi:hypothetical protein